MTAAVVALNRTAEVINEMTPVDAPNKNVIYRERLEKFLESLNGKFVSMDFFTKSNRLRTINGRFRVRRYVKGTQVIPMRKRYDLSYVVIYEVPKPNTGVEGGYRNVNLATVVAVRANGIEYDIV